MRATTGLGIRCLSGCNGCLGYGLLLGFFGVGAAIGAVVLQRARSNYRSSELFLGRQWCSVMAVLSIPPFHA